MKRYASSRFLFAFIAGPLALGACGDPAGPKKGERISLAAIDAPAEVEVGSQLTVKVKVTGDKGRSLEGVAIAGVPLDTTAVAGVKHGTSDAAGMVTMTWTAGTKPRSFGIRFQTSDSSAILDRGFQLVAGPPAKLDTASIPRLWVRDTEPLSAIPVLDAYGNAVTVPAASMSWSVAPSSIASVIDNAFIVGRQSGVAELSVTLPSGVVKGSVLVQPYEITQRTPVPRLVTQVRGNPGSMVAYSGVFLWESSSGWIIDSIPNAVEGFVGRPGSASWAIVNTSTGPSCTAKLLRVTAPAQSSEVALPRTLSCTSRIIAGAFGDTIALRGPADTIYIGPSPWRVITGGVVSLATYALSTTHLVGASSWSRPSPPAFGDLVTTYTGSAWTFDSLPATPSTSGVQLSPHIGRTAVFLFKTLLSPCGGGGSRWIVRLTDRSLTELRLVSTCNGGGWVFDGLTDDDEPFFAGLCPVSVCPGVRRWPSFLKLGRNGEERFLMNRNIAMALDGGTSGETRLVDGGTGSWSIITVKRVP